MILLVNPRATRPGNRRFPLSVMAVGAGLPADRSWEVIDGNLPGMDVLATVGAFVERQARTSDPVQAVGMTVMPGPQLVNAVPLARAIKSCFPQLPIVWGGNFASLYPEPVLNARYVDWLIPGIVGMTIDAASGATLDHWPNPAVIVLQPLDPANPKTPIYSQPAPPPPTKPESRQPIS